MNEKHICDILESLHHRLFKLEAYNQPLATSKLMRLITEYGNWEVNARRGRSLNWFMNNGISHRNASSRDSMEYIDGGSENYGQPIQTGGRDWVMVSGWREYQNREAQVTFPGVYKVWVRPNQRSNFMEGPEFINPIEVINYLNEQVYPTEYREWIPPTRVANPRDIDQSSAVY